MPWGDGTGPWWAGGNWMCGRGFWGRGYGRGFGRGMGRGFGMGFGRGGYWAMQNYAPYQQYTPYTPAAPSKEEEKAELKEYVMELEAELKEAKRRITELEGKK